MKEKEKGSFRQSIINCVNTSFGRYIFHEHIIDAEIVHIRNPNNPACVDVQPLIRDENNELYPVIAGLSLDNQNIPRTPQTGDIVRVGFVNSDITEPFILDYVTNIYDQSNDMFWDASNQPNFKSDGETILLKKQASISNPSGSVTAPGGGGTAGVDQPARDSINELTTAMNNNRTAINSILTLLTNLNLH